MTNEWHCAQCLQPQTAPAKFVIDSADFCSQECMDAHADSLTSYFDKRMQVFEGMRAEASADEFAHVITNERGLPIAIREPLGELEALREENRNLTERFHRVIRDRNNARNLINTLDETIDNIVYSLETHGSMSSAVNLTIGALEDLLKKIGEYRINIGKEKTSDD